MEAFSDDKGGGLMFSVRETSYPALAEVDADVNRVLLDMARIGAEALAYNLGKSSGGQGRQYPSLPNRSSAPGQYPVKQSGKLQSMVGWGVLSPGTTYFGLEPETPQEKAQALSLELGAPRNNLIARAPVRKTAADPSTLAKMRAVR